MGVRRKIWVGLSTIHWEEIESVCNSSCLVLLSLRSTGLSPGSARLVNPEFSQHSQVVVQASGALTLSHSDSPAEPSWRGLRAGALAECLAQP